MIKAKELINYALQAVAGGYCWGADGQICTPKLRQELAQRAPDQAGTLLTACAKWDGKPVWDCSGLFRGAWRKLGAYKSGGATTIFTSWLSDSGTINTMPDEPGLALFRGTLTPKPGMSHCGLYVGDGMVVDARGSSRGVIREPLIGYTWTHWGRFRDVAYNSGNSGVQTAAIPEPLYRAQVVNVKTEFGLNLRISPENAMNTILGIPKDGVVDVLQENCGDGFAFVRYYGTLGYCTRSYLARLAADDDL